MNRCEPWFALTESLALPPPTLCLIQAQQMRAELEATCRYAGWPPGQELIGVIGWDGLDLWGVDVVKDAIGTGANGHQWARYVILNRGRAYYTSITEVVSL